MLSHVQSGQAQQLVSGTYISLNKSTLQLELLLPQYVSTEVAMSVEIKVPPLGESIVDATIATWLKHEGEPVHKGDTLVELETDKINVEVNAEEDGVLQKMVKQVGDVVGVGEVIVVIAQ